MADVAQGAGFRIPFRHQINEGSRASGGANFPHYLDGCDWLAVEQAMSNITDAEAGLVVPYGIGDDFQQFQVSATAFAGPWQRISGVGTPTNSEIPTVLSPVGGVAELGTSAAAADNNVIKSKTVIRYTAATATTPAKRMWFSTRVAVKSAAANGQAVFAGLAISTYTAADLGTQPTDGIYFLKTAAGTTVSFIVRKASVSSTITDVIGKAGVAALAADTFVELSFRVNESGSINVYVNGITNSSLVVASSDANLPAGTTNLEPYLGTQVGTAAAAIYLDVDNCLAAVER